MERADREALVPLVPLLSSNHNGAGSAVLVLAMQDAASTSTTGVSIHRLDACRQGRGNRADNGINSSFFSNSSRSSSRTSSCGCQQDHRSTPTSPITHGARVRASLWLPCSHTSSEVAGRFEPFFKADADLWIFVSLRAHPT